MPCREEESSVGIRLLGLGCICPACPSSGRAGQMPWIEEMDGKGLEQKTARTCAGHAGDGGRNAAKKINSSQILKSKGLLVP